MKRKILTLVTVFSMCCLVACGSEKTNDTNAGGKNDESIATAAPADEAEVTPVLADKSTTETTPESTEAPTPEPTADPVETLTTLRNEALAAHSAIVEQIQYRYDVASEILEVAKRYPDFQEDDTYELFLSAKSNFEDNVEEGNLEEIVGSSNSLNIVMPILLAEYPDLKTTEEFQKLVEAPSFDIAIYNGKVDAFNYALSNSTATEFEELPYCLTENSKLEY